MQQLLHPFCLALAVAGFLLLLRPPGDLRRDYALAALAGVYGFSALSFMVSLEPVWRLLDDVTGRPSTGILGAFGSVVALLALQPIVLAYWELPLEMARKRARVCLIVGAVVILTLAVLFFQLTPTSRTAPQNFTVNYIHTSAYQAYLVVYIIAYTIGETVLAVGCWRVARHTDQVWIARGLRVVGTGAVLTYGYCAVRLIGVGAALGDLSPPSPAAERIGWFCADGGTTLTLIGFFVPTLTMHVIPSVRAWIGAYHSYRSLTPLWEAMHDAVPTIALQPARTAARTRLLPWDATWHLYRRAVEIRDGQWVLQRYLEESVRRVAEQRHRTVGLSETELASAATADQLHAALAACRRDDSPAANPTEYADACVRESVCTPDDDVRALLRIAAHFDASPINQKVAPSWS